MNTSPKEKKDIALNIQLSSTEKSMLEKLKADTGKSFGTLLREAVVGRYRMRFNNEPQCADHQTCKCPHLHQIQPIDKKTDAELVANNNP